ncbi:MAG: DUF2961 domain-containing protein [Candidatus Aminicenantes bacterium]|nr:MAG: DUF2961 domain-containing protein [Candidatus Aminicenantes bacterium]
MHTNQTKRLGKKLVTSGILFLLLSLIPSLCKAQDWLRNLGQHKNFTSKRISSFDRTGGNKDRLNILPGETVTLAEINGPGAIHHIWVTIAAESFYGRKIIVKMYWDGEDSPSVESPIGDFFGVGHGLNRNLSSLPISCSSEGRARNCYWYMPFSHSARITATNEGTQPVGAFYYYIDYRELPELPQDTPYFHARYLQEMPCQPGKNYLICEASGRGHYVGCNLSILQTTMGWWGEGDDMIYVDGEEFPSLYGTGSEDYFSDAWGMREDENLFYGCPLQESDFLAGSKATVYRFHISDPIPFKKSIRVTIEHGHANNRSDLFSSVAYWYQSEPHKPYPRLPSAEKRLPFALPSPGGLVFPKWEKIKGTKLATYKDKFSGMRVQAQSLSLSISSYYNQTGSRYPVLTTENSKAGTTAEISFAVDIGERYDLDLFLFRGPNMGKITAKEIRVGSHTIKLEPNMFEGYSPSKEIARLTLKNVRLYSGENHLKLEVIGKSPQAHGSELAFVNISRIPSDQRFITDWNLIGPFNAPDMSFLQTAYPPEREIDTKKTYRGKGNIPLRWEKIQAEPSGYMRLENRITPSERGIVYGLVYVFSPDKRDAFMQVGSDDGVRLWLNKELIHTNPAYRGAYPDQDRIPVSLKKGWNTLLIKVLQGGGGWGYYVRFVDPEGQLRWKTEIE